MKIVIGSDHAGFELKQSLIEHMRARGVETEDVGAYDKTSCHYPVIAKRVADAVAQKQCDRGVLVCGTGIGMSMAANKVRGIRAAAVSDCFTAKATRMHNDANILCLGERTVGPGLAAMILDLFLDTEFEGGRHQTRVDMISDLEK
mgnify:CR=1 FL=1